MKTFIGKYKFTILSVVLVMIAIMMPGDDVPSVGIPHIDKVVHCGMFGFVTLCYYWDYFHVNHKAPSVFMPLVLIALFGGLTEVIQIYVPGRSCDYKDLLADSLGIVLAIGVSRFIIQRLQG